MEIKLTSKEISENEYNTLRRLNGKRFDLENKINKYFSKNSSHNLFDSLSNFFIMQELIKEKISRVENTTYYLSLATSMAATVSDYNLNLNSDLETDFFNNKQVNYGQNFPLPTNDLISMYIQAMEKNFPKPLEIITNDFYKWAHNDSISYLKSNDFDFSQDLFVVLDDSKIKVPIIEQKSGKRVASFDVSKYVISSKSPIENSVKTNHTVMDSSINSNKPKSHIKPNEFGKNGSVGPLVNSTLKVFENDYIFGHENVKEAFSDLEFRVKNRDFFASRYHLKKVFPSYLLVGPPGTGKTTLVENFAKQCGLVFIKVPCPELVSSYFGQTSANIHGVYQSAKKMINNGASGVIIFFDEFDHIAKNRDKNGSQEYDSVVTTINENIGGGSSVPGVVTIAATNCYDKIDDAIKSRFKKLEVLYPSTDAGVIGIHKSIIKSMEDYSGEKMFDRINYDDLLTFCESDERYKSGRIIDQILHEASMRNDVRILNGKHGFVTTADLLVSYQGHKISETSKNYKEIGDRIGLK